MNSESTHDICEEQIIFSETITVIVKEDFYDYYVDIIKAFEERAKKSYKIPEIKYILLDSLDEHSISDSLDMVCEMSKLVFLLISLPKSLHSKVRGMRENGMIFINLFGKGLLNDISATIDVDCDKCGKLAGEYALALANETHEFAVVIDNDSDGLGEMIEIGFRRHLRSNNIFSLNEIMYSQSDTGKLTKDLNSFQGLNFILCLSKYPKQISYELKNYKNNNSCIVFYVSLGYLATEEISEGVFDIVYKVDLNYFSNFLLECISKINNPNRIGNTLKYHFPMHLLHSDHFNRS
ncbi:hypothetical protein [Vibrio salinus]|uniref:hypothetical protein n=1 Tax=Vibrio salinus TaxID=2899784 RepID=UPI001E423444|nr:hypothetical protein [Vibrio salinus]MCE0495301.1 hypothetical protein [Vibrio salinus]